MILIVTRDNRLGFGLIRKKGGTGYKAPDLAKLL
jgi:hypothetical protein